MKTKQFNVRALRLALASVLAVGGGAFGVNSYAGTATANLSVTASILANCTISTTPVAFGTYDPIVTHASAALDGTGTVSTICTIGTLTGVVTLGQGIAPLGGSSDAVPLRQMASGTDLLAYFLYSDTGRTTVWGNTSGTGKPTGIGLGVLPNILTVFGRVTAGQNKPAGSYADTVVATVTF